MYTFIYMNLYYYYILFIFLGLAVCLLFVKGHIRSPRYFFWFGIILFNIDTEFISIMDINLCL